LIQPALKVRHDALTDQVCRKRAHSDDEDNHGDEPETREAKREAVADHFGKQLIEGPE
jgi:hypothetical protein